MGFINGIIYNARGFRLALKSPKLLALGLTRLFAMLIILMIGAGLIMTYHGEIMSLLWLKPQNAWLIFIWQLLSWLVSLVILGLAALLSYLLAQILFSVLIMDMMSRVTEKLITGKVIQPYPTNIFRQLIQLITQELPRTVFPILIILVLMILGWLTPLGPFLTVLLSLAVIVFLAWDNTDLIPARQLIPFKHRFRFLLQTLPFHLGFGLWFLIPGLNILFLSFAPIGATLYHLDRQNSDSIAKEIS
jgi:CysZ protein